MPAEKHSRTIVLNHRHGLHVRPGLAIVNAVRRVDARATIQAGGRVADAASILEPMGLGVNQGVQLGLTATGTGAAGALDALARLIASLDDHCGPGGPRPF